MFNRGRGKCGIKEFSCVSVAVILINLHTQRDEFWITQEERTNIC